MAFKVKMLGCVAALVAACGATRIPVAGPDDAARAASRFPDLTVEELASGRTLFASHCGGCHAPPAPASLAPDSWPGQVVEMKARAKLDDHQARLVERYLVTMALPPRS